MNAQPQAQPSPKDETKKDSANFKEILAKFINPFYVSFVIFWVVCNYDFLLILIGKKAILHDLYSHFGYGCKSGKEYVACTDPWLPRNWHLPYALRFILYSFYWKIAIPLGLTWLSIKHFYPKFVMPLNHIYNDATNRNLAMEDMQRQLHDKNERLKLLEMQKLKLVKENAEIKEEIYGLAEENEKLIYQIHKLECQEDDDDGYDDER